MKNKKALIVLIAALALLIGGASILYGRLTQTVDSDQLAASDQTEQDDSSTQAEPDTGENSGASETIAAPDFIVYDLEGNEVHLHDYFGKPIVVNFWASWCGPCQMEMPDFEAKYLELGDEINFLMVNMTTGRETLDSASAFITESGYTFPVLYDTAGNAAATYGAYSLPTSYFIDAQGSVIARAVGAIDADTLQRGIDMIRAAE